MPGLPGQYPQDTRHDAFGAYHGGFETTQLARSLDRKQGSFLPSFYTQGLQSFGVDLNKENPREGFGGLIRVPPAVPVASPAIVVLFYPFFLSSSYLFTYLFTYL